MRYFAFLAVLVVGIYSCDPSFDCTEVDTLSVFDDLRNVDSIQYYSNVLLTDERAFDTIYSGMKIFINNDIEYDAMKQRAINNSCTDCVFPTIDFTNRTLIGYYFEIGCAQVPDQRFVTTTDSTYAFYAKFINNNRCAFLTCPNFTYNWMLVPKVESIDKVEFFDGEFYYDCDC